MILAVTAQQAEVLNYSQIEGLTPPNGITLVLRSAKDFVGRDGELLTPPDTVTTGVILAILVEQYGVLPPASVTTARRPRRPWSVGRQPGRTRRHPVTPSNRGRPTIGR